MSRKIFIGSAALLIAISLVWWREGRSVEPVGLTPTLTGQIEYCLTCHADLPEISPSHPVEAFGCVLCHGGERLALDPDLAHSSMRGGSNPSALQVVEQSCGGADCHSGALVDERDHIQRVMTSIQATYTGAITSVRYTFGAQADQTPRFGAYEVTDTTLPSATGILSLEAFNPEKEMNSFLKIFGENCLSCHINAPPLEGEPYTRLTGCAACHSPMPLYESPLTTSSSGESPQMHILTTKISYTQCNTCHNRGNYDLRTMMFVERVDPAITRLQNYYQPIAQFTLCEYTLDCVDCHTRTEAMGNGDLQAAKTDAQYTQCKTCHGTLIEPPLTRTFTDPEDITYRLTLLNPVLGLQPGDTFLVTEQGEPLWNTRVLPNGRYELIGKATYQRFSINPVMGSGCQQDPARQESQYCHECHAIER